MTTEERNHPTSTDGTLMFDIHCQYCKSNKVHPYGKEGIITNHTLTREVSDRQ